MDLSDAVPGRVIERKLRADFTWRYEPAYYFTRILSTWLFGIDLMGYSVVKAVEITGSCIFLYYCGKRIGATRIFSFLFAALSLVGYQSAVWWKLPWVFIACSAIWKVKSEDGQ